MQTGRPSHIPVAYGGDIAAIPLSLYGLSEWGSATSESDMWGTLSHEVAAEAAIGFLGEVPALGDGWGVTSIEAHLPPGWGFPMNVTPMHFAPFTVEAVARGIRRWARRFGRAHVVRRPSRFGLMRTHSSARL